MKVNVFVAGLMLIYATLVIYFTSCRTQTKSPVEVAEVFPVFRFEEMLKTRKSIKLSEIASDIKYVKLELTKESSICANPGVLLSNNFIFINCNNLLQFSRDGEFLRRIGSLGKGPKEYLSVSNISVNEEIEYIYIHAVNKILIYTFQGKFIKEIHIPVNYAKSCAIDTSYFIAWSHVGEGNEENVFAVLDKNGKIVSKVKNHFKWPARDLNTRIGWSDYNEFYTLGNKLFFKDMYTDTIYTVSEQKKITPVFFLDLGKYKIPDKHRPSFATSRQQMAELSKGYMWANVQESDKYIFTNSKAYSEKKKFLVLTDKLSKSSVLVSDISDEYTGFINDIDGGFDFWPRHISGSWMYINIPANNFLEKIPDKLADKKDVKYPERKNALKNLVASIDEGDNPIIMLVKLK